MDSTLDLGDIGFGGIGNSHSDSVYRLREEIERFMITDINNPAGSAMAQSEIVVMWDQISKTPGDDTSTTMNHIPGGCNVLYRMVTSSL